LFRILTIKMSDDTPTCGRFDKVNEILVQIDIRCA
jgi:hypothetical protein